MNGPLRARLVVRIRVLALVLALCTLGLIGRLADLQLVRHSQYETLATEEHAAFDVLPAHRGPILDRNGNPLAISTEVYSVRVDPRVWSDRAAADQASTALGKELGQDPTELQQEVARGGQEAVQIAADVPFDIGQRLDDMNLPGVALTLQSKRLYPEGDLASNLLGFIGSDGMGLTGLEHDANSILAGKAGSSVFQRDAFGSPIGSAGIEGSAPQAGGAVTLTIDRRIQQISEQHLDSAIAATGADGGAVIAMNPQTGAILAMASRPSFRESTLNPAVAAQAGLYRDRAVTDLYEPGSEFKLITMAAAIDSGLVNANTTYDDTGTALVNGVAIHNWDESAHGITTMTTVIVDSLNTGAVWVAQHLGPKRFYRYVSAFGFGKQTGIGLSGEASGEVRTPQAQGWSPVDLATNAFGQGISVTPLQLITAVSTVINGGRLMRPYIVKSETGPTGTMVTRPTVVRQVISRATSATLRQMMQAELRDYTLAQVPGYTGGGKSGTAYIAGANGYKSQRTIPSYIEFVPYQNPQVILLVKLDNLGTNVLGGVVAAPLARDILKGVLPILDIPPDRSGATPP